MLCHYFGVGEAQQQVAVMRVLLLSQLDLAWQALADGVREGVELVEDGGDAGLFGEGFLWVAWKWNGDFVFHNFRLIPTRHFCSFRVLHVVGKEFYVCQYLKQVSVKDPLIEYMHNQDIAVCSAFAISMPNFFQIGADISNQNVSVLICG